LASLLEQRLRGKIGKGLSQPGKKGNWGRGAMGNPEERPEKSMATAESQL